ncbi:MAG: FlgO family outer membrane protein [Betaproteobacteria bacterium]|nr:FlgO family outer membrane protein [Betaproteobacteria bacterium]MCL2885465.1 FlgO family outer membrane protein [Betaproteobacteria bacterium]
MRAGYLLLALSSLMLLGLGGCASEVKKTEPTWEQAAASPIITANYRAADALLGQIQTRLNKGQSLIVATVVNIDALDKSSTLGRLISEQVAGRFTQAGYRMIEMKFGNAIYMQRNQGELMLTREIDNLAKSYDAQAVVVGTYGVSSDFVYVNLKVIQPGSNVVLAVHDYVLPLDPAVRSLLRSR